MRWLVAVLLLSACTATPKHRIRYPQPTPCEKRAETVMSPRHDG